MLDSHTFLQCLKQERIVAIVRGTAVEASVPLAHALHAGGIRLLEFTCNTPGAAGMIARVRREGPPDLRVGAGTVTRVAQAEEVLGAGAQFVVAPDVNAEVIGYCAGRGVPVVPGAATPTEILTACRLGATAVKLFPAAALGLFYLRQIRAPLDQVALVAVGGIDESNVGDFLRAGCVAAGLGASLIDPQAVARGDWAALTERARLVKARAAGVGQA